MTSTCALFAPLAGLAPATTLHPIWFKFSTGPSEIVVGAVIASAVIQRVIANSFLLPRLLPQASASKKPEQAALWPAAAAEGHCLPATHRCPHN